MRVGLRLGLAWGIENSELRMVILLWQRLGKSGNVEGKGAGYNKENRY